MRAVYISGCFGVLHPGSGKRGVLICGPLSDESLNAYRPLLFLAERLSEAGLPSLRLAWYGSGDSAGGDTEPNRFARWLQDVAAAVRWMQEHCGVDQVTLAGYRIGASLAARAACDIPEVDSLVLLTPIAGRYFLHELTLSARIAQRVWQTTYPIDDGLWFESHGLRIDRTTRDALNAVDLRKLPCSPAAHILLLAPAVNPGLRAAADGLSRGGASVSLEPCTDLERMQRDSPAAHPPHAAFDRILDWVCALPQATKPTHPSGSGSPLRGRLPVKAAWERPIRFGPDATLFGIMSQPERLSPHLPAVLLVNTSANPRWGNARVAVDIARALALDGVASLRMDASGIGDAAPRTGETGRPYADATTTDVLHGVAELARRAQRPVVILGVCSGAYHALQAGIQDLQVCGLVLVNLQRFIWQEGDSPDRVRRSALRPNSYYLKNIFRAQSWMRLIRADFDVANLGRVFVARLARRALASADPLLTMVVGNATRVGKVRQNFQKLSTRGVHICFLLGSNDPGVEELTEFFGREGWRLRRYRTVTFSMLPDSDHTLGAHPVRTRLIGEVRDWLAQRWPADPSLAGRPDAAELVRELSS